MAESTLSLTYSQLQTLVGDFLGLGRTAANWSTADSSRVDEIIESGLRDFYSRHNWSFLRPTGRVTTVAPYTTGTVDVAADGVTVTLTGGTFPTWAASGEIEIASVAYGISSRDSGTQLTLETSVSSAPLTGQDYTVFQRDYALPDDFGGFIDDAVVFDSNTVRPARLVHASENVIRERRNAFLGTTRPRWFAMRPSAFTAATGQRFEIMLDPPPDDVYVFEFRYEVAPDSIDSTNLYHRGGMHYAEVVKAACLAAAELFAERAPGANASNYQVLLQSAIQRDNRNRGAEYLGSQDRYRHFDADGDDVPFTQFDYVTYNGSLPS